MEFWLIGGENNQKLRLPVPPPEFSVETGHNIHVIDVNEFGEYSIKGDKKLDRISFKSFFPAQYYNFCQYRDFPPPYDFVKIIEEWEHNKLPFRMLITDTSINKLFDIDSFIYGERAGSRDVDFELSIIEYRKIEVKPIVSNNTGSTKTNKPRPTNPPPKSKTHRVVRGDTLWDLARKFYGDPYRWGEIAKKNGIKDPRKMPTGITLVIP